MSFLDQSCLCIDERFRFATGSPRCQKFGTRVGLKFATSGGQSSFQHPHSRSASHITRRAFLSQDLVFQRSEERHERHFQPAPRISPGATQVPLVPHIPNLLPAIIALLRANRRELRQQTADVLSLAPPRVFFRVLSSSVQVISPRVDSISLVSYFVSV